MSLIPPGLGGIGAGGSAAFGGAAIVAGPGIAAGLRVYLFSPIVSNHEALGWQLMATERSAAVAGIPPVHATRDLYANAAETAGIRLSLLRSARRRW